MRRVCALLGLLVAALGIALAACAAPASAHAVVEFTDPPDGMRYAQAPAQVLVAFSEPVSVSAGYLQVVDSTGARVDDGDPAHPPGHGDQLAVQLRAGLGPDVYVMSWRVVSVDSHVVAGSARFAVGDVPFAAAPAGSGGGGVRAVEVAAAAARAVMFAGLVLLGGLWALWLTPIGEPALRRARRVAAVGWAAAVIGLVAGLLIQGAESSGRGLGSVWRAGQLGDTAATRFGQLSLWALGGLIAVGALLPAVLRAAGERRVHGAPEVAGVLLLGSATALAATGHASTLGGSGLGGSGLGGSGLGQSGVALAANALHLVAAMAWLGGVATLGVVLLPAAAALDSRGAAARFLPVAAASVAVLALTGVYQGWRESESLAALVDTMYGRLVLVKAALLVLIVAVAAAVRARWARLTDSRAPARVGASAGLAADSAVEVDVPNPVEAGAEEAPARVWREATPAQLLRRWLVLELAIGAAALAVAATLVGQTPAKEAYAAQRSTQPITVSAALSDGGTARLTIDPARHGTVSVDVRIDDARGWPMASLRATRTGAVPVGPLDIEVTPADGAARGPFSARFTGAAQLPVGGTWVIDLSVTDGQFEEASARFEVSLA